VLHASPTRDEVHNDGNNGEEQQEVNQKTAYMEDEKAAKPQNDKNDAEDEKHGVTSSRDNRYKHDE
jgi:hypothetical protein